MAVEPVSARADRVLTTDPVLSGQSTGIRLGIAVGVQQLQSTVLSGLECIRNATEG
jgi:hypothetical protein